MTTPDDTSEIERLKATIAEFDDERFALLDEIEALRNQLAEVRFVSPYDQPRDVLAALETLLPGWPCRRWRRLAGLIKQRAQSCSGVS